MVWLLLVVVVFVLCWIDVVCYVFAVLWSIFCRVAVVVNVVCCSLLPCFCWFLLYCCLLFVIVFVASLVLSVVLQLLFLQLLLFNDVVFVYGASICC